MSAWRNYVLAGYKAKQAEIDFNIELKNEIWRKNKDESDEDYEIRKNNHEQLLKELEENFKHKRQLEMECSVNWDLERERIIRLDLIRLILIPILTALEFGLFLVIAWKVFFNA